MPRKVIATATVIAVAATSTLVLAQNRRPPSPAGASAAEIGGKMTPTSGGEPVYTRGKWIEVTYGRPIKRGRDVFGSGASYGKVANPDAPVWRAGANVSTQLKTEVALVINGKTVPPGTYTMFIDLKPNNWTLIVSRWKAQADYDPNNTAEIWGAYSYTPDKDVVRAPMKLETLPHSHEELSWEFLDVTDAGGTLAIMWDKTMASVPFKAGT